MSDENTYRVSYWAPVEFEMEVDAESEKRALSEAERLINEEMYYGDSMGPDTKDITNMTAKKLPRAVQG